MRPRIVLGSALTAAVLTMLASVISGIVAADQVSATDGAAARGFLVVGALALTSFTWWQSMLPSDRPGALLLGLMLGWLFNTSIWTGRGFLAHLFTDSILVAALVDGVLWALVSLVLVSLLVHASTRTGGLSPASGPARPGRR